MLIINIKVSCIGTLFSEIKSKLKFLHLIVILVVILIIKKRKEQSNSESNENVQWQ